MPRTTDPSTSDSTAPARATEGRGRRLVRAAVAAAAVGLVVLLLAVLVREQWHPLVAFDEQVVAAATAFAATSPGLVRVLLGWQWAFAASRLFVPFVVVCALFWWRTRRTTRTVWALGTVLAAWSLSNLAKELVRRARPVLDEPVAQAPGYSFPSGHAANTAAMTTALVVLVWPVLRSMWLRVLAVVSAVVLMLLTSADRVLLGVHYPTDVIAGTVFGVGFVLASYLGYRGWSPTHESPAGAAR
ncbi:phosphatase PAP2 family protein [Cellulomonas soli]|uniref:phosphatase PAP2 family protein n=1 Tax=Cellulomonas soli TaxID=931535 RepID=UPI0015CBF7BF|nr:phosphatase PAP2 family protein [Cellulomonas soli]NYI59639.1 undecaprenyl-diphosphatase [Cellulomonas soli]